MKLYRLCKKEEINMILSGYEYSKIGKPFIDDENKSTHHYKNNKNYLHFFDKKINLLHLNTTGGRYICYYNIPEEILKNKQGFGVYLDYIYFKDKVKVPEFAVESDLIKFEYLKRIDQINDFIDIEDFLEDESLSNFVETIYDNNKNKVLKKYL